MSLFCSKTSQSQKLAVTRRTGEIYKIPRWSGWSNPAGLSPSSLAFTPLEEAAAIHERLGKGEIIGQGDLFYLWHPGSEQIFSGYGLAKESGRDDLLVGLLTVDRPYPADPSWLQAVHNAFGECHLVPMASSGERGLACQMQITPEDEAHLRRFPSPLSMEIQMALEPLIEDPPHPVFNLSWDNEARLWRSVFAISNELPAEIREVFEWTGYGCLPVESNIGVVHVCHASDADIEGFTDKPVWSQWQLILTPSAPLIRLELAIPDRPDNPFRFESFLNVAEEDQARVLDQLANQDQLFMAFYGDDLGYRYAKVLPHSEQQWQQLDELMTKATDHWNGIPPERRDYDRAKAEFMSKYI